MNQPSSPIEPALLLWAARLGRASSSLNHAPFHRQFGFVGPLVEEYADGYKSGEFLPALTTLAILELSLSMELMPPCLDDRMKLLHVWQSLSNLYGVLPGSVAVSRAGLIIALHTLLLAEDPPPNVEIYVPILDAELDRIDWDALDQLSPDCALQVQQIEEDWRPLEAENELL
ncbi:hypothetical protein [Arthrobacter sp. 260]|uniref:hypothetical protein n=1 Tax=Arthrobacter sp. 260 TaxID=2735314 RepID=UPI001491D970|nr:hypothetical protein [Arthrobacter sp. 260]NOJ61029.1 hypothetical protein [Arthrobacter sp. 260]